MQWLTTAQASELLEQHGPNALPEKKPLTHLEIFFNQLKSPLVYILIAAAVWTRLMWDHEDTIIIAIAVWLNTVLGYYQESKAWDSLQALKKMLQVSSKVIRNSVKVVIPTSEIVPWDLVVLKAWEKLPADGKVVDANRLFVMEAMLTGESIAIQKNTEDKQELFMGTIVQWWQWIMKVEKTWAHTEMGKIATSLQVKDALTPLQKQLDKFSTQLTIAVWCIIAVVIVIGYFMGQSFTEILKTWIALAVGAIPEWLLIALTAVLAIGMQRILKRKWLVKNLVSAETLWWVTVICSDKTWTLTQWTMDVVTTLGNDTLIAQQAVLLNDEDNAVALATWEWWNKTIDQEKLRDEHKLLDHIPFSSENKCIVGVVSQRSLPEQNLVLVNGAPDYVSERCHMEDTKREELKKQINEYTELGYRLVWYARKTVLASKKTVGIEDAQYGLEWIGFVWLSDPVRIDVKDALAKTRSAWVKLIVITGDFAKTAKHIMHQLGVDVADDHIMLWSKLTELDDYALTSRLEWDSHVKLFARTKPEQKMRIVDALKEQGEVVAMMWDGVNDAPALKKADIWVVVNEATDVAKESADLILLDSSFATIVSSIEEGRGMFDNIRKIILYLMCDAFVQIIAIIIAMVTGFPIPITAWQILWINLISDGFPSLALTVDPKRKWLMQEPPRDPKEKLITKWILGLITLVSISWAVITFILFINVLAESGGDVTLARSVAFASFWLTTTMYVYSVRSLKAPVWSESPLNNKWLIGGLFWWGALIVLPFILPWLWNFLDLVPIGNRWYAAAATGLIVVCIIEVFKAWLRENKSN